MSLALGLVLYSFSSTVWDVRSNPERGPALTSIFSAFSEADEDIVDFHFFFSKLQQC